MPGLKHFAVPLRAELAGTLKLAGPIVLSQVGHMSMGLVDTMIAGHISTTALGGLGLAANFFWTFTSISNGCLLSLDTFFAQAVGARDEPALQRYLGQSLWSCVIVGLVSALCIVGGGLVYLQVAAPGALRDAFRDYVWNILWCLPSLMFFFALQRYWQARGRVLPFTVIILAANVLNLAACLGLGLGYFGLPRLEVRGIALATVTSRYAMLLAGVVFTIIKSRRSAGASGPGPGPSWWPKLDWAAQRHIFQLGLPAAGHTALEIGAFTIAVFVVGALGAVPLAAHHVCLIMAAFTFMFPLGFGSAAAVRVGTFIGAGQPERARLAGWVCIGVSVAVMSCFALMYLGVPRFLLANFTKDPAVIEVGVKILMLVALFQIADGIQVSTTGALRGLGNTRAAMIANLIGHYPIGLALGLVLCYRFKLGVVGIWAGLAAGLISVAIMLVLSWRRHTRELEALRPVSR